MYRKLPLSFIRWNMNCLTILFVDFGSKVKGAGAGGDDDDDDGGGGDGDGNIDIDDENVECS